MFNTLRQAIQACAVYNIKGDANSDKVLAFLPGVYSAMGMTQAGAAGSKAPVLTFADPTNLTNAGYDADQVADDYIEGAENMPVKVTGANKRTAYRDFLNTVQRVGVYVTSIVIQNKVPQTEIGANNLYDQEIVVSRTAIGTRGESVFIQLQNYVSVNAYDRSKITIDLSDEPLYLTPEMYMAMNIPAGSDFSIQFFFESPALN